MTDDTEARIREVNDRIRNDPECSKCKFLDAERNFCQLGLAFVDIEPGTYVTMMEPEIVGKCSNGDLLVRPNNVVACSRAASLGYTVERIKAFDLAILDVRRGHVFAKAL